MWNARNAATCSSPAGDVFESSELKDMAIEEKKDPDEEDPDEE
jgi:hypothetical protein